jgi:hypothetical protein
MRATNYHPIRMPRTRGWLHALCLWFLGASLSALAFPPAPYHVIYGLVRDQYGTPIQNTQVKVLLTTPTGTTHTTTIDPGLAVGVNYELRVPMDSVVATDLYQTDALVTGNDYTLRVIVGNVTNVPIEVSTNYFQLGQPAQLTEINLTLGVDSNHDGIPDAWELAFLASIGSNLALSNLNAGLVLTGDGRTLWQQYLLATTLSNTDNPFAVRMVSQNGGQPVLEFPTTTGRSYTVLGSTNLQSWSPLQFQLVSEGPGGAVRTNYTDSVPELLQIQVVQPGLTNRSQFFRIQLQ